MKTKRPEWVVDACCAGKHRFTERELAARVAKASAHRKDKSRPGVYHCRYCGGWHIGNSKLRKIKDKRKDVVCTEPNDQGHANSID